MAPPKPKSKKTVAFFHPDLGMGGAERLVVDAALALKSQGHNVHIFTNHFDPNRAFQEVQDGSIPVTSVASWLPRTIGGGMTAFMAYIKMIIMVIYVLSSKKFDVIFCDQVSACVPFVRLLSKAKVVFYCHFPDLLLVKPGGSVKKLYRSILNWIEEKTTGQAHVVMVNSKFTAGIFKQTFRSLSHIEPTIVYPSLNVELFDQAEPVDINTENPTFLSINRYEDKKNLPLAVKAFVRLVKHLRSTENPLADQVRLCVVGGYDNRLEENRQVYQSLIELVEKEDISSLVTFKKSISDVEKLEVLQNCTCLVYTPENEHFGITPLEAMYMKRPVIAANSGGPLETVASSNDFNKTINGQTGFLCDPTPEEFCKAMIQFVEKQGLAKDLGENGKKRVVERFSFKAFTRNICAAL